MKFILYFTVYKTIQLKCYWILYKVYSILYYGAKQYKQDTAQYAQHQYSGQCLLPLVGCHHCKQVCMLTTHTYESWVAPTAIKRQKTQIKEYHVNITTCIWTDLTQITRYFNSTPMSTSFHNTVRGSKYSNF